MQTVRARGVDVPVLGFGTWELTGSSAYDNVRAALELGYRHIDTAQMYGNEDEVGRAIADSEVDRDQVFLTTKVPQRHAAPEDVVASHEESLRTLGVDAVDLLLIHWPTDTAPIEETLEAMEGLRERGLTRLIGVSNYTSEHLARALEVAPIATNQVEYHPLLDQDLVLGMLRERDLFLTAYCPLAHGELIGDETLTGIGEAHGKSAAQVALRWLIEQPGVVALPRSETRQHIADNLDIFDFALTDEDRKRIDDLPKDQRQVDPPFAPDWD